MTLSSSHLSLTLFTPSPLLLPIPRILHPYGGNCLPIYDIFEASRACRGTVPSLWLYFKAGLPSRLLLLTIFPHLSTGERRCSLVLEANSTYIDRLIFLCYLSLTLPHSLAW